MGEAIPFDFFQRFPMRSVTSAEIDSALAETVPERLTILYLWGRNCPNCDVAKRALSVARGRLMWSEVRWFHDNVYDDFDMATRYGLHGIPAFIVFRGRKPLGRITSWPGADAFIEAIERQLRA
jgi:hypothetical protein